MSSNVQGISLIDGTKLYALTKQYSAESGASAINMTETGHKFGSGKFKILGKLSVQNTIYFVTVDGASHVIIPAKNTSLPNGNVGDSFTAKMQGKDIQGLYKQPINSRSNLNGTEKYADMCTADGQTLVAFLSGSVPYISNAKQLSVVTLIGGQKISSDSSSSSNISKISVINSFNQISFDDSGNTESDDNKWMGLNGKIISLLVYGDYLAISDFFKLGSNNQSICFHDDFNSSNKTTSNVTYDSSGGRFRFKISDLSSQENNFLCIVTLD